MIDTNNAEAIGRDLLAGGRTTEDVLAAWRESGLSILHSIQCLSHITGMSLGEAKTAVHLSGAWSDLRQEHDRFHDQLVKTIDETNSD